MIFSPSPHQVHLFGLSTIGADWLEFEVELDVETALEVETRLEVSLELELDTLAAGGATGIDATCGMETSSPSTLTSRISWLQ